MSLNAKAGVAMGPAEVDALMYANGSHHHSKALFFISKYKDTLTSLDAVSPRLLECYTLEHPQNVWRGVWGRGGGGRSEIVFGCNPKP